MFNPAYFSGQYFPPAWFAPGAADEEEPAPKEVWRSGGGFVGLNQMAEARQRRDTDDDVFTLIL